MMIPSENYTYPEVRQAVGSVLMHKYAEGLPGKRYYQGNQVVDAIENYCQKQALSAFGVKEADWGVNVQPHSGSEANLAAISALVEPGGKIMSLFLPDGGHLSHGWQLPDKKLTLVSKFWQVEFYHLEQETSLIDYATLEKQAKKFKPKLIISGGTAYPQEIDYARMSRITKSVGAYYLADVAHEAGLIVGKANRSPFPFADVVTMTTHKTLRGPRGAIIFGKLPLMAKINSAVFPGLQGGPHLHTIAGIALALKKAREPQFTRYARQTVVNAQALAEALIDRGLTLVSGGTAKHLVLVDLRPQQTNGWLVATALEAAGIIANRNTVPQDGSSPFYPQGLRMGTPALTVRGMKEKEMSTIAGWMGQIIDQVTGIKLPLAAADRDSFLADFQTRINRNLTIRSIRRQVAALCRQYPLEF